MPSPILQAFGQSLALTSLVAYNLRLLRPEDALTLGTILQTARLFGGEADSLPPAGSAYDSGVGWRGRPACPV